jgi:hypothetical protein
MKNLKYFLFSILIAFSSVSCDSLFDTGDTEKAYDGPTVVEFAPLSRQVNTNVGTTSIRVQLIGPQRPSATTVNISVVSTSTAVAGTHYSLPSTSVTIPANESFVNVPISIVRGSLNPGQSVQLRLLIDSASDGIQPAANLRNATVFISYAAP